ncbi:hypothetical protein [Halorussus sp. AFM4]|uniref:hypothetical protein n=1 Tax=Halorussus sp. AFM4 TaxID=3421651 RepID=UPI003EC0ABE7
MLGADAGEPGVLGDLRDDGVVVDDFGGRQVRDAPLDVIPRLGLPVEPVLVVEREQPPVVDPRPSCLSLAATQSSTSPPRPRTSSTVTDVTYGWGSWIFAYGPFRVTG